MALPKIYAKLVCLLELTIPAKGFISYEYASTLKSIPDHDNMNGNEKHSHLISSSNILSMSREHIKVGKKLSKK